MLQCLSLGLFASLALLMPPSSRRVTEGRVAQQLANLLRRQLWDACRLLGCVFGIDAGNGTEADARTLRRQSELVV